MKTIHILIIALFSLQVSVLFAGNESFASASAPIEIVPDITNIIPVTPSEATFEDMPDDVIDFNAFAPVTPAEAQFEEMVPEIDLEKLAPVIPQVADFE